MTPASTRLDELARLHPEMGRAAATLRALLDASRSLPSFVPDGVPDLTAARVRLEAGLPALDGEPILDGERFLANLRAIARSLGADETAGAAARALERALGAPTRLDADGCAAAAAGGAWDAVAATGRALGLEAEAFVTIADHAARPALRTAAGRVSALVREIDWSRGSCPACGAPPLLAELRGPERDRVLRCGRCASAWTFPRVRCAACGERDHHQLGYLHAEGEGDYRRADRCDRCRSYVKAIAVLDPLGAEALLEEDLATAGLDLIALELGYHR